MEGIIQLKLPRFIARQGGRRVAVGDEIGEVIDRADCETAPGQDLVIWEQDQVHSVVIRSIEGSPPLLCQIDRTA